MDLLSRIFDRFTGMSFKKSRLPPEPSLLNQLKVIHEKQIDAVQKRDEVMVCLNLWIAEGNKFDSQARDESGATQVMYAVMSGGASALNLYLRFGDGFDPSNEAEAFFFQEKCCGIDRIDQRYITYFLENDLRIMLPERLEEFSIRQDVANSLRY